MNETFRLTMTGVLSSPVLKNLYDAEDGSVLGVYDYGFYRAKDFASAVTLMRQRPCKTRDVQHMHIQEVPHDDSGDYYLQPCSPLEFGAVVITVVYFDA